MTPYTFHAMGTEWALIAANADALLREAEAWVHAIEARLSRFEPGSVLSRLHRERSVVDPVLAEVVRLALAWRGRSRGRFDPTLGATLAALGYDVPFERVDGRPSRTEDVRPRVRVDGDRVELEGDGALDLGGIAKGWAVDHVARRLAARGVRHGLVDGGGDLRAIGGPWPVGVGGDDAIVLHGDAVATSSSAERAWWSADGTRLHHLLDPRTGRPARSPLTTVTVRASDATTADVLAKAVLIDPDTVMPLLPSCGASARVADVAGRWWNTSDWEAAA